MENEGTSGPTQESMRDAASEAGVAIVAGDTKVVQKGSADKLFINTSGIGVIEIP